MAKRFSAEVDMRVLHVEDDSTTAASIAMMLRAENFIVDTTDLGSAT